MKDSLHFDDLTVYDSDMNRMHVACGGEVWLSSEANRNPVAQDKLLETPVDLLQALADFLGYTVQPKLIELPDQIMPPHYGEKMFRVKGCVMERGAAIKYLMHTGRGMSFNEATAYIVQLESAQEPALAYVRLVRDEVT